MQAWRPASPRAQRARRRGKACQSIADSVVAFVLVAAVVTVTLISLALGEYVSWWAVLLPSLVVTAGLWIFFSGVLILWLFRCRGDLEDEESLVDVSLDTVLAVFKFCAGVHAYLSILLLCLAVGLICAVAGADSLYWLAPVVLLAVFHLAIGTLLKEPEVNPYIHLLAGSSLLGHVFALGLKFAVSACAAWPWAVVFTPSWLTYASVGFVKRPGRSAGVRFGLALTAVAFTFSAQVLLTLRLDDVWAAPWSLILPMVLVAVLCGVAGLGPPISARLYNILATVVMAEEAAPQKVTRLTGLFDDEPDQPVPAA